MEKVGTVLFQTLFLEAIVFFKKAKEHLLLRSFLLLSVSKRSCVENIHLKVITKNRITKTTDWLAMKFNCTFSGILK